MEEVVRMEREIQLLTTAMEQVEGVASSLQSASVPEVVLCIYHIFSD